MNFMDAWEQIIAKQEQERDRLRVNQITVRVNDKKKSKHNVHPREKVIEYGFVERDLYDENLFGRLNSMSPIVTLFSNKIGLEMKLLLVSLQMNIQLQRQSSPI